MFRWGEEADKHLRNSGASASTFDSTHISISSWATKSAVEEELYHTRQLKRLGKPMWALSDKEVIKLEIEAQNYLLKNAKAMKFSYNEIEELKNNLLMWKKRLERYGQND